MSPVATEERRYPIKKTKLHKTARIDDKILGTIQYLEQTGNEALRYIANINRLNFH